MENKEITIQPGKTYFEPGKGDDVLHIKLTKESAENFIFNIQVGLNEGFKEFTYGISGNFCEVP